MQKKTFLFKWRFWVGLILVAVVGIYAVWDHKKIVPPAARSSLSVVQALSGDPQGFARALEPRIFEFPKDHGAHPSFRNEWWYFTGNLKTPQGRHFGYQFTLFRTAISDEPIATASQWGANQIYMGHWAVTDSQSKTFYHFERFSRGALDLAGAKPLPFRVWLENWAVFSAENSFFPLKIQAAEEGISLELELESKKNVILQGNQGLSQKGHQLGNASYYYSFTRLKTQGQLQIEEDVYSLEGWSWMDREWSSSTLESQQAGWDWFALQLSNGWELMFYQLRLKNGKADTTSAGVLVGPAGQKEPLHHRQVSIEISDFWKSPTTHIRYPAQWKLNIPEKQITLTLTPHLSQQEFDSSFHYWEGAIKVQGEFQQQPIEGNGYAELTGYLPDKS